MSITFLEYGSAFVCGKSRFEEGKFHVRDDPILQISCGDEHTGVVTGSCLIFNYRIVLFVIKNF